MILNNFFVLVFQQVRTTLLDDGPSPTQKVELAAHGDFVERSVSDAASLKDWRSDSLIGRQERSLALRCLPSRQTFV